MSQKTIALTGATGFIGGHLMAALRARGDRLRALTRRPRETMSQPAGENSIDWITGDITDPAALARLVSGSDAVIHCAGLVKALDRTEFFDANAAAVSRLAAVMRAEASEARLIHLSSLAAREPELSDYAASKAGGETALRETSGLVWAGLRPPAVYGPGDMEILKMFKSLKYGLGFLPGTRDGRVSLIHARDLTAAVLALLDTPSASVHGLFHELDDGRAGGYALSEVYDTAARLLDRRVRLVTVPPLVLRTAAGINLTVSRLTGSAPMLTPGKVRELTHPDWVAQQPLLNTSGLWQPEIGLETGLGETLAWYRHNLLF